MVQQLKKKSNIKPQLSPARGRWRCIAAVATKTAALGLRSDHLRCHRRPHAHSSQQLIVYFSFPPFKMCSKNSIFILAKSAQARSKIPWQPLPVATPPPPPPITAAIVRRDRSDSHLMSMVSFAYGVAHAATTFYLLQLTISTFCHVFFNESFFLHIFYCVTSLIYNDRELSMESKKKNA